MNFLNSEINEMYLDVLKEFGNIGIGNVVLVFVMMIGRKINMKVFVVKMVKF